MSKPCSADSTSRTVLGMYLSFTFRDMDRECGDCSISNASITVSRAPGGDWQWTWRATINSSDTGDRWDQKIIFFRADGSELFEIPGFWQMGQDIHDKNAPQEWVLVASTSDHPPLAHGIPQNYMEAASARINCEC